MPNLSNFLGAGSLVTAVLFSGVIILFSNFLSAKLTKGRLHPSAIAIFFGLVLAYVGGAVTGGTARITDETVREIFDLSADVQIVKP